MKKLYAWFASWGITKKLMRNRVMAKILDYEFLIYCFFGLCTTILNYLVFWGLNLLWDPSTLLLQIGFVKLEASLVTNAIAFVVALIFSFVTNKIWVFESKSWASDVVVREALSFTGARVYSFVIEEVGVYVLMTVLGIHQLLTKAMIGVIVIVLNYIFSKFLIFTRKGDNDGVDAAEAEKEAKKARTKKILVISALLLALILAAGVFAKSYEKKKLAVPDEGTSLTQTTEVTLADE